MALTNMQFTKDWRDPVDFPTIENSETQVRADIQILYDELAANINTNIAKLQATASGESGASNIGVSGITGFAGTTIQSVIEAIGTAVNTTAAETYTKDEADAKYQTKTASDELLKSITFDPEDGSFTITTQGGLVTTIDTDIEKIPVSVSIIQSGSVYKLRITNEDGTYSECDVSALFNAVNFTNSETIAFTQTTNADGSKTVSGSIRPGSVTESMLEDDFRGDITGLVHDAQTAATNAAASESNAASSETNAAQSALEAANSESDAANYAIEARSYARGGTGSRAGENTDNAKYYKEQTFSKVDIAEQYRLDSEAYARGTRDGDAVGPSDPAYHNNSKYYSEQSAASALSSAQSSSSAAQSAADALADKNAADASASAAAGSATAAAGSATSAAGSASAASTSETNAAASASTASAKASEASTSASNASTSETNAAASASSAATSEANAATSASDAASDAQRTQELTNEAMEYATDAAGSQIDAETAARNAAASASTASTKASQAATSASNASTSETNAANSATAAAASAASVGTQASDAEAAARGTRNGVPVSSTDEFYNDNAKYYKDQAAAIVGPQQPKITATGILKGEGDGMVSAAVAGTDYQAPLPSQSGQSGKFLTTDGSALSWGSVDALPSQSGQSGKFLTTNGTAASWSDTPMIKGVDYVTAGKKSGTTLGTKATAEGYETTATANYSHAEGNSTTASGIDSHAEGLRTKASGSYSHAEGSNTTAQRRSQHVFGEYNVLDATGSNTSDKGSYVEIVGNGTSSARSNARTLDWSGNEVLAGKLTVGAGPTADMDVATKEYVDSKEVPPEVFYINVTVTYDEQYTPTYTPDKTFADVTDALTAGKLPIAKIDGAFYILGSANSNSCEFYLIEQKRISRFLMTSSNSQSVSDVIPSWSAAEGRYLAANRNGLIWKEVPSDVFVAAYGTETFDNIRAAHVAGKIVFTINDSKVFRLIYCTTTSIVFVRNTGSPSVEVVSVSTANVWTAEYQNAQGQITASGILKGDGAGGVTAAVAGTDYVKDYVTAGQKNGTTLGFRATAEGNNTSAIGYYSHAEGDSTSAIEHYSHAEGSSTTASGNAAHAEGSSTTASGESAHAEGSSATASGESAHAEGSGTRAGGTYAHAEGYFTNARRKSQHVFGEYNVLDTTGTTGTQRGAYIEIVGKGTADNARSNARTLDWSGNEVLAGKLTVGAAPTADMDVATKKYVDATRTVAQGGTGATSFTANSVVMSGSSTTAALTTRAVTNNTAASTALTASTNIPTVNTLVYGINRYLNRSTLVNAADTGYTTYMARGEALNSADTNPTVNGAISWTYA